jgi:hypothetical protein
MLDALTRCPRRASEAPWAKARAKPAAPPRGSPKVLRLGRTAEHGSSRTSRTAQPLFLAVLLLFGIVVLTAPSGALEPRAHAVPGMVRIVPTAVSVSLTEETALPAEGPFPAPPSRCGSVVIAVESSVPHWAVAAELDPFQGPEEPLPLDRVRIAFIGGPAGSLPFVPGTVVAAGSGPAPIPDATFRLEIQPQWMDAPGSYTSQLRLTPLATSDPVALGTPAEGVAPAGPPQSVTVEFEVPAVMSVSSEGGGFSLRAEMSEGTFYVTPDLTVVVSTNRRDWQVHLEGSSFTDGKREIPLARLRWSPVGPRGVVADWTRLTDSDVLLAGQGRRGQFRQQFRLALDVTKSDPAGSFGADLRLVGTGQ